MNTPFAFALNLMWVAAIFRSALSCALRKGPPYGARPMNCLAGRRAFPRNPVVRPKACYSCRDPTTRSKLISIESPAFPATLIFVTFRLFSIFPDTFRFTGLVCNPFALRISA